MSHSLEAFMKRTLTLAVVVVGIAVATLLLVSSAKRRTQPDGLVRASASPPSEPALASEKITETETPLQAPERSEVAAEASESSEPPCDPGEPDDDSAKRDIGTVV